ncbi:MAG TPA: hypothetical protein VGG99_12750 [Acetobacteraceae bacterium]|jgi:hypothetical protein
MSKATYPLKLPASIKAAVARLAKEDGVSLNQWIATAVAQKVARWRRRLISSSAGPGLLFECFASFCALNVLGDGFMHARLRRALTTIREVLHAGLQSIIDLDRSCHERSHRHSP